MKPIILVLISFLFLLPCYAQWSSDVASPNLISGGTGEQALPKVGVCTNGSTYISYFDNSSGGYKVWLKLLDMDGVAVWPDPKGIEMAGSISETWLTDYDLTVDGSGNALLCFQDIRSGFNSVYIYKVSPEGTQLWGENGICLSTNSSLDSPDYTPVVICTNDNSTYVAWQHQSDPTQVMIQKLDQAGQTQWLNPLILMVPSASTSWPQFVESTNGDILVKYYVDSGPFWAPNRELRVAKISPGGEILCDLTISDAYGIAAWTQLIGFAPDGSGGAVLTWHDDRDLNSMNQAYFAHIDGDGNVTTPEDGAYISSSSFYNQFYPRVSCDFSAQEARVAMRITDSGQNQCGLIVQVLDYNGNRQLGDEGYLREALSYYDNDPLFAWNYQGRFHYLQSWMDTSNPQIQTLRSARNAVPNEYNSWHDGHIATTQTPKFHFDFDSHEEGWVICVWEDGSTANDVYAMRYWYNGNVGACNGAPENVTAEFIPPSSIRVEWEAPFYSEPVSYHVQANDLLEMVPATQTEYTFTDLEPGTYIVRVIAIYPGGEESPSDEDSIQIEVVSADDLVSSPTQVSIFPNPFARDTELRWDAPKPGFTTISVYNLRGQKLFSESMNLAAGAQSYKLQTESLPAGIYFLRLQSGTHLISKKILKMR